MRSRSLQTRILGCEFWQIVAVIGELRGFEELPLLMAAILVVRYLVVRYLPFWRE